MKKKCFNHIKTYLKLLNKIPNQYLFLNGSSGFETHVVIVEVS